MSVTCSYRVPTAGYYDDVTIDSHRIVGPKSDHDPPAIEAL